MANIKEIQTQEKEVNDVIENLLKIHCPYLHSRRVVKNRWNTSVLVHLYDEDKKNIGNISEYRDGLCINLKKWEQ